MPTISSGNFLTIADSLAQAARTLYDAFTSGAIAGGEPISGTGMGAGAANNAATIMGTSDIDVAAGLAKEFDPPISPLAAIQAVFRSRVNALINHVGGNIGAFLITNNARVDWRFAQYLCSVPAAQIMPPAVDPLATFAVTGSGAGTFTNVASINTANYGPAALQVVATDGIGAANITVTLTLTTLAGGSVTKTVAIPNGTVNGTTFAVDAGAINYTACTAITITGGTNGDTFKVRSLLERAIAL